MSRAKELSNYLTDSRTAILISTIPNIRYFTEFDTDFGYVVITKNDFIFITDSRYIEAAKSAQGKNLEISSAKILESGRKGYLSDLFKSLGVSRILLETEITVSFLENLKETLSDFSVEADKELSKEIFKMRSVKDEKELSKIKEAAEIASLGFDYILSKIAVGMSEKSVGLNLEYFLKNNGINKMSFDTIAVSGKNSSLPHGTPSEKLLQRGEFLTLDFGVIYDGYCSDMTRTVALGYADDKMREVYETVKVAGNKALSKIKPGVSCNDIDKEARDYIKLAGYGDYFRHSTGHGVGIEIHESPAVTVGSDIILKSGMVITVEPGIYLENEFGVRIEDMVAVTDDGILNMSGPTKELIIL